MFLVKILIMHAWHLCFCFFFLPLITYITSILISVVSDQIFAIPCFSVDHLHFNHQIYPWKPDLGFQFKDIPIPVQLSQTFCILFYFNCNCNFRILLEIQTSPKSTNKIDYFWSTAWHSFLASFRNYGRWNKLYGCVDCTIDICSHFWDFMDNVV